MDKTIQIRTGEDINIEKLTHYIHNHLPDVGNIISVSQFPGGFSNLTYLIQTDKTEIVLRRPPLGANIKSGHDMEREFKVLSLLEKSGFLKIPRPLSISTENEVINTPFYIMERLNGTILRAKDVHNTQLTPTLMTDLSTKLIENLAELHALDIEKTGLNVLGKAEGYVQRQIEGWIKRYENSETDNTENMTIIAQYLRDYQTQLQPQTPTFLHNDYKFDNVVWDNNLTHIIGVLDWEMATIGDPLMDLGATLAYWCEEKDSDLMKMFNLTALKGCLTRQEAAQLYAHLTGRNLKDILFYYTFGLYKNAVIIQQIYARWKKGITQDNRFSNLNKIVSELAKTAVIAIKTKNL